MLEGRDCRLLSHRQYRCPHAAHRRVHRARPYWSTRHQCLVGDAADTLANCPNADYSNFEEAVRIIRKDLMPRLAEPVRAR